LRLFRPFRLLLLILLLAFLPVQSWAAAGARAAGLERLERTLPLAAAMSVEGGLSAGSTADASTHNDAQDARSPLDDPSEKAVEGAQAGADLAEQWLPPTQPRLAALPARASAPRYTGAALPDPDLPLPPRPPRG